MKPLSYDPFPSYLAKQGVVDIAWERCERRFASLPTPMRELAARFLESVATNSASHRAYFSSPLAPPLLYMPLWLFDGFVSRGEMPAHASKALIHVLSGTIQGYIAIRIQDDVIDEPTRTPINLLLFGNTCFSGMVTEYVAALGESSPQVWSAIDRAMVDFSRLTLAEQDTVRQDKPYEIERFDEHADKVAFARVPMLVVAALAGRLDIEPHICALVHRLGIAYGIANDVLGWPRDVRAGHRTWLLASAGLSRGDLEALGESSHDGTSSLLLERLRASLYEGHILANAIVRAIGEHRRALEAAHSTGMVGFDDFTAERIAWLDALAQQTSLLTLQRLLHGKRGESG